MATPSSGGITKQATVSSSENEPSFASRVATFDFRGDAIDMALRKLLAKVQLPKEAQQIDRAMEDFAKRYHECNPDLAESSDEAYAVAFSILMLHTDAHNKNVRQKMNKETFIMRTRIIEGGENVPAEALDIMYDNIVSTEFTYADGENHNPIEAMIRASEKPTSWFGRLSRSDSASSLNANSLEEFYPKLAQLMPPENPFSYRRTLRPIDINEIHVAFHNASPLDLGGVRSKHRENSINHNVYTVRVAKAGILERKYDMLPGGKKATARGWRPFGVVLTGSQIVFFSDIMTFESWLSHKNAEQQTSRRSNANGNSSRPSSRRTMSSSSSTADTISPSNTASTQLSINTTTTFLHRDASTWTVNSPQHTVTSFASICSTQSLAPNIAGAAAFMSMPSSPTYPSSPVLRPVQIISLTNTVSIYDESYTKYPHVFRLLTGDGQQFLFRAKDDEDLDDWMAKINYAATSKTTGLRLRPSRNPRSPDRPKREEQLKAKVLDISQQLVEVERILQKDLRLRRNLMVLVPLQKSSRDRVIHFAEMVGRRIQTRRLEMQKLECYRDYLEAAVRASEAAAAAEHAARKMSAPLLTRSLLCGQPFVPPHRSATVPAVAAQASSSSSSKPLDHIHNSPSAVGDDQNILWSNRDRSVTSDSSSSTNSPTSAQRWEEEEEDKNEQNKRRSSCPQIPPFAFTVIENDASSSSGTKEGGGGKNKGVAFDVPDEGDKAAAKPGEWTRRRSSSNPVKPKSKKEEQSTMLSSSRLVMNRERSSSEASSYREDDDELTVVNMPVYDSSKEEEEDDLKPF